MLFLLLTWTQGQSVSTAGSQLTQNWKKCDDTGRSMVQWRAMLPFRGIWTGWRNGLRGTSCISTWRNTKFFPWGEITPCISTCWGLTNWKTALPRKTWGSWWTRWLQACIVALWQKWPTISWVALERTLLARQVKWSLLSAQHWWHHAWSVGSSTELSHTRKTWTCCNESRTGQQRWLRD